MKKLKQKIRCQVKTVRCYQHGYETFNLSTHILVPVTMDPFGEVRFDIRVGLGYKMLKTEFTPEVIFNGYMSDDHSRIIIQRYTQDTLLLGVETNDSGDLFPVALVIKMSEPNDCRYTKLEIVNAALFDGSWEELSSSLPTAAALELL